MSVESETKRILAIRREQKMTLQDWAKLERIGDKLPAGKLLLKRTESEDQCPEDFGGPCLCRTCVSYG